MSWYAIRTVYHWGTKTDGTAVFEERIVVFEAISWDEAHAKAHSEADAYAKALGFTVHPDQVGYQQDGDRLIDGHEVWSELFEADASLEDFYESRYSRFDYHPE